MFFGRFRWRWFWPSRHDHPSTGFVGGPAGGCEDGDDQAGGIFQESRHYLRPGQFGKIRAQDKVKRGALLVPQRAVNELQGSYQIAVVDPDNKVDIRNVKVGERTDSLWMIGEG